MLRHDDGNLVGAAREFPDRSPSPCARSCNMNGAFVGVHRHVHVIPKIHIVTGPRIVVQIMFYDPICRNRGVGQMFLRK